MNLIEQLGGYKKAKNEMNRLNNSDYAVDHSYAHEIEQALDLYVRQLEQDFVQCRNQHTIFDEGEKIVFIDEFMHNELMTVSDVNDVDVWMDNDTKRAAIGMVRHATDAEIKAGKRRPELDSDTCSDIRNHVSPLTKVIDR